MVHRIVGDVFVLVGNFDFNPLNALNLHDGRRTVVDQLIHIYAGLCFDNHYSQTHHTERGQYVKWGSDASEWIHEDRNLCMMSANGLYQKNLNSLIL